MNYTPGDIFRAMGRHWAGEDEFRYPMDPNLRDSGQVLNTMTQEWSFMVTQSEDLYNQMIRYGLAVPHRVATNMQRDSIHRLRMALNRIREENNRMLIRLNRYGLQVRIRELRMYGDYQEARNMEWCLSQKENLSDVDMSDEE
jgi:hypothetical protein